MRERREERRPPSMSKPLAIICDIDETLCTEFDRPIRTACQVLAGLHQAIRCITSRLGRTATEGDRGISLRPALAGLAEPVLLPDLAVDARPQDGRDVPLAKEYVVIVSIGDADEDEQASRTAGVPFVRVRDTNVEAAWKEIAALVDAPRRAWKTRWHGYSGPEPACCPQHGGCRCPPSPPHPTPCRASRCACRPWRAWPIIRGPAPPAALVRLPLLLRPRRRRPVPHRSAAGHRRPGVPQQRQLGRADALRRAAADQAAGHVRRHRRRQPALRRRQRLERPPALGPGRDGDGVPLLLVLPPAVRAARRTGRGLHRAGVGHVARQGDRRRDRHAAGVLGRGQRAVLPAGAGGGGGEREAASGLCAGGSPRCCASPAACSPSGPRPPSSISRSIPLLWWRGRLRLLWGRNHLLAAASGPASVSPGRRWPCGRPAGTSSSTPSARRRCSGSCRTRSRSPRPASPPTLSVGRDAGPPLRRPRLDPAVVALRPGRAVAGLREAVGRAPAGGCCRRCTAGPGRTCSSGAVVPEHAPRHSFPLFPGLAGLGDPGLARLVHRPAGVRLAASRPGHGVRRTPRRLASRQGRLRPGLGADPRRPGQ